jgi:hypothetical protein
MTNSSRRTSFNRIATQSTKTKLMRAVAGLLVVNGLLFLAPSFANGQSYVNSNAGIKNIQASSSTSAGATDSTGACVPNAPYNNHRSESWIAVDPTNPNHLVGTSKFFFDPLFYLFHLGSYASFDGGKSWTNAVIPGFDCQSASTPANSWTDTTDPIHAFDSTGRVFSTLLPFSFTYNSAGNQVFGVIPNSAISVVKSADGGNTWTIANQGEALATFTSSGLGRTADKQWMTADANPSSPFHDNVYVGWTLFSGFSSEIWFSGSTDHGEHFSTPVMLSVANNDGPFNTFIFLGTGPDGALYISYSSFPSNLSPKSDVWLLKSTDGGQTFSGPTLATRFRFVTAVALPNTTFRDGISYNMAVNPANGHVLLALEVQDDNGVDVQLAESTDGGKTFSTPIFVNDAATVNDGTDQFQPTVAASPNGTVAVAFYDRRLPCPTGDANILFADQGRTNFCINTSIQFFSDGPSGLQKIGSNVRVTQATWDPQNPGTNSDGLPHPGGPNSSVTFIGDYFGLTLTNQNAFALFVSNHNFGQNPFNDQQQFVGIVPIPSH